MRYKWFSIIFLFLVSSGCHKSSFDPSDIQKTFLQCIGEENDAILDSLSLHFQRFLEDNNFCSNEQEAFLGYKKYLEFLLNSQGLDPSWKFRKKQLEGMISLMEEQHFADFLKSDQINNCVLQIRYPDSFMMANYRKIMPQHMVSPEQFASAFVAQVDEEQFRDPVLRKLIALEYFLGPVLYILRPDESYLTSLQE